MACKEHALCKRDADREISGGVLQFRANGLCVGARLPLLFQLVIGILSCAFFISSSVQSLVLLEGTILMGEKLDYCSLKDDGRFQLAHANPQNHQTLLLR